jgi:hypothetical protein
MAMVSAAIKAHPSRVMDRDLEAGHKNQIGQNEIHKCSKCVVEPRTLKFLFPLH